MVVATKTKQTITLPALHPGQQDIAESKARFKVVVCGRRYGKTTLGEWFCVKGALEDPGIYWWVGPNFPSINASGAWAMLKFLCRQIDGIAVKESDRSIIFPNGSEIWIKSADNPETLRGSKLKGVVLDEFAQTKETTWVDVLRPALTDWKGWALFIGTPAGRNWAFRLFERARLRSTWETWQKPTTDNPFIDPNEVDDARLDMSEESFAQEYLADFGASQYLVFPEINQAFHEWRGPVPEFISYHGGMDFGGDTIGAHASTVATAGRTRNDELIIIDAFEESGPNIAERQLHWVMERELEITKLRNFNQQRPVGPPLYLADKTQMVGIQFMKRMGLNVKPTKGGPDSVSEGIELMHRRFKLRPNVPRGMHTFVGTPEGLDGVGDRPRFFWLKGVPYVQEALERLRYPEPKGEDRVESKNHLKVKDDMFDAIRYLIEGVDRHLLGDPQKLYTIPSIV
ncbi:hypothetical protein LCGC14_1981000 [marine sediment metagenome]|uniref:Uncharacterized protein n=1 Tax=marine sediment metagenome TaxID=412755 RepID=A0A0F9F8X2_9ZZZZ